MRIINPFLPIDEYVVRTELIRCLYNIKLNQSGYIVTIGNFDGIHLGHQALLDKVRIQSKLHKIPSLVISFEPHPPEFFSKNRPAVARLTRMREKFNALAQFEVDQFLVLRFNDWLANLSAEDFIRQVLSKGVNAKHVVVGDDFRFGRQRQGDIDFLKRVGANYGITAEAMESIVIDDERVSSTAIRQALAQGDQVLAEKLLGRPYSMEGRVVHGEKLGRQWGFPTANIFLQRLTSPVQGIYVVRLHGIGDKSLPGVASIGTRPTVGGKQNLLEVHIFDFDQDIYGQHVRVEFCQKLRDEKHFATIDLLIEQIKHDAAAARNYFKHFAE